jgi:ubiquinone/menaquinone biosynthesis C-methylase UbiE
LKKKYGIEPENKEEFTLKFDKSYSKFSKLYSLAVTYLPIWKTWIKKAIPHLKGPRVLESSFGTGYLISHYANKFETYGIDYNQSMVDITKKRLEAKSIKADLRKANVEELPFEDSFFDTIVSTMAFSGYPDGNKALKEFHRVLKPTGQLVLLDVNFPQNSNFLGMLLAKFFILCGDIVREMPVLFKENNFDFEEHEVGGFGSVHLYIAKKIQ